MPSRRFRSLATATLALLLLGAAPAYADFSVSNFTAAPASAVAGAHSDFKVSFALGGSEKIKDLDLELPPGLVGNPRSATTCSATDFAADNCDLTAPGSVVGDTTVNADAVIVLPVPITATGTIYSLAPHPGEPARLGIIVRPPLGLGKIFLESPISLRTTSDFGLTSLLRDMPTNVLGALDVKITGIDLTLHANAANGAFMTNPTSCNSATTRIKATSYGATVQTAQASFTPTDCAHVPFTPSIDVAPGTTQVDTPTSYGISVNVPPSGSGRQQSHISRVAIVTPPGTNLNAPLGDGLEPCTDAQFGQGSDAAPTCPEASKVGTAQIDTPLLGVLDGTVYLAAPKPDNPFGLFVAIAIPGGQIKLGGKVTPDPSTGQLSSVFDGLPPVPFTRFTLTFRGGDKAVLVNDTACGVQASQAQLTPYSGAAPASPASQFTTSADGAGAPCADPPPFAPTFAASSDNLTAGASPKVRMDIGRAPGQQLLKDLELSLPAGLVGGVKGVGLCVGDAAKTGDCPADSKVGTATTVAGAGGAPLRLGGDIFLTTGDAGAVAALLAVVPAKVGPYDFGKVVLKSNISVRAGDAGFEVRAANLPQILGGIPLRLRGLSLALDRPGFMRNPTSCAAQQIQARFTSVAGARSTATAPYQVTGCDALAFGPKLTAVAGGKGTTGRFAFPGLTTTITQAPGEAATSRVAVSLPNALSANRDVIGSTCSLAQLDANACPAKSKVGEAQAFTPLLPVPLSGPVYITENPGGLPKLTVDLKGLLSLRLTGEVSATTVSLTNTFAGIPDVPLSNFVLRFAGGKGGLLQAGQDLCTSKGQEVTGTFTGHNGKTSTTKTPLQVEGCPPLVTAAVSALPGGKPSVRLSVRRAPSGQQLNELRVTLPKGMTFDKKALGKGAVATVGTRRVSVKNLKVLSSRTLRVAKLPGTNVDALRLALSRGAVKATKSLSKKARKKPTLAFTVLATDALGDKYSVKKTVRGR